MKKKQVGIIKKSIVAFALGLALTQASAPVVYNAEYSVDAATVNAPVIVGEQPGTIVTDAPVTVRFKEKAGESIYWSFDGNIYVWYDAEYPPVLEKSRTVYAYTYKNGVESKVKTFKYKLVPAIDISVGEGSYNKAQTVKITSGEGTKIYYTLDGKKPTTKSKKYTKSGIKIDSSCTLRLMVKKTGWTTGYYEFNYEINSKSIFDDINDYTNKPIYQTLTKNEKAVYKAVFDGFSSFSDSTSDLTEYKVKLDRAREIFRYVISENPQLFWANDGRYNASYNYGSDYVKTIKLFYTNDKKDALERQPKLQKQAKKIIEDAKSKTNNTFDYLVYLHDSICKITTYDNSNSTARATAGTDDIFLDGRGLCTAYARAFGYLCQLSGIDCINIEGNAINSQNRMEGHCWNKIKIDGKWYNVDVCWDDQDEPIYTYFCLTDERMGVDHYADDFFDTLGFNATATKYNYLKYLGIPEYEDANSAYMALIKGAADQIVKKKACDITIYFVPFGNGAISNAIVKRLAGTDGSGSDIWSDIKSVSTEADKILRTNGASVSWSYTHSRIQLLISLKK